MNSQDQAELARALFEESGDAMFLVDPDTDQLVDANPVVLRLTGFERAEVVEFPATYLFRVEAPGGLHRLRGAFTKTMVFHGQDGFLLRTKEDAAWIPVNLTVSRLHLAPKPLALVVARDDRERRAALAQARWVEAELRTVLANAPAALWSAERVAGPDVLAGWQFRYVSPLLAALAGRPPEFLDHPLRWAEAVHPADRDEYRVVVRKLLTGAAADAEQVYRVQAPDGSVRWVRDRLLVVRDRSGRPARMDGCVADVTAQRQAEETIRQSELRFRALVEKSADGIMLLDERGVIRYASPASKLVTGQDPPALVGTSVFDRVHPAERAGGAELFARILAYPGESFSWTGRGVADDGAVRVIETTACNRLADPSVRAVVVNYRDVTERDRAARKLERQHALLEGLFASVPDLVCYKDRDLRFLGGNPAFEELAGRPEADLIGKTCREVFTSDWAARLRAAEPGVIETGRAVRARDWVTYPDGRTALLDIVISPLRGTDGGITGVIIVGRDVTDRDRLEEALRQAAKMEAVGRLAGGIAHDFNNLLTVILGNLELVRGGIDPADATALLTAAEGAGRQAAELTQQILGFARRRPLVSTVVDLNALAREELTLIRRSIDPRVTVVFAPAPGLRPVAADPVQVRQILMNLCLNARDAMPHGGSLTIETAPADTLPDAVAAAPPPPAGYARLSVADTGCGMTEEVRAKVFEPFFTTKELGKGTGLGLAVVYGVAQAHGGRVWCHSEPGRGSRFDVYLPSSTEELPAATQEAVPAVTPGQGETILLVDDEGAVRALAEAGLRRYGYRVILAEDGAKGVEAFKANAGRIGLVVLDMMMPNMNGRQAFDAIRAVDPRVPILFASGYPAGQLLPGLLPRGTSFLPKPYTPTRLAATIRRMLDEKAHDPGARADDDRAPG
ncbi:MAG: Blue-light-activated protein [Gemmataceae bacterium]|nr:Blue-light-activated protein [Gemmataceae bacterium]